MKTGRWAPLAGGLLLFSSVGCHSTVKCCTSWFSARSATFADVTPVPEAEGAVRQASSNVTSPVPETPDESEPASGTSEQPPTASNRRFSIPPELPGADAAPLAVPQFDTSKTVEERRSIVESLFAEIAPAALPHAPLADTQPFSLAMMQQLAVENSPVIRQAAADVEAARGRAIQVGLYPNPELGYEGDSIGTAKTAGYNGVFFSQEFVTAGKLSLAQNAALHEVRAKQAELRKARIRMATDVRRSYFQVLVAQEQLKFQQAVAQLSAEVYKAQIDLVAGGEAAPYEPLQLRVIAVQARNSVTQASNGLEAAWRQLAAACGVPHMARQETLGSVETSVPLVEYDLLASRLQQHSDVIAARARISRAVCNLRLQEVTPIPNLNVYGAFQHDDTTPLSDFAANVQVSAPVPVFDRNQGNITAAHAELVRARQDLTDVSNRLMSSLADVYNRQSTTRSIAESYRSDLLPDQVRVYRGVYDRFLVDGESVDFAQVVLAQQTLTQVVSSYLQTLGDSWSATVDLADLIQVDDLMTMDGLANSNPVVEDAE